MEQDDASFLVTKNAITKPRGKMTQPRMIILSIVRSYLSFLRINEFVILWINFDRIRILKILKERHRKGI